MTAYYNEINPWCVAQLRRLIAKGWIADGEIDSRSIVDVRADDLRGFEQCHFFAGIGGWSLALRLAGWGDGRPVWTGSCPCGPFSLAGEMERFADERHLWPDWVRLIEKRKPAVIFGEQVASATEWLRLVRGDLEALDYAVGATSIEAASAGADHLRDRFWFVADCESEQGRGPGFCENGTVDHRSFPADDGSSLAMADGYGCVEQSAGARRGGGGKASKARDNAVRGGSLVDGIGPGLEGYAGNGHQGAGRPVAAGSTAPAGADFFSGGAISDADGGLRDGRAGVAVGGPEGRSSADGPGEEYGWVVGIDGKYRRVKPGIRLLADGVSCRVDKLMALGNAIDPRPAAEFIGAYMDICKI